MSGNATLNVSQLLSPFDVFSGEVAVVEAKQEEVKAEEKPRRKARKPHDPNAPKRPLTAYFRFLNEVRPLIIAEGEQKPKEISTIATERWNKMPQADQQKYKDAYLRDMEGWKVRFADYVRQSGGQPDDDDAEVDGAEFEEALEIPAISAVADGSSDSDSDTDTDSDDEPAPIRPAPPPQPSALKKKPSSPETTMKTPKSAKKAAPVPMFSSVNVAGPPPPSSSKKRKSEAADDGSSKKAARPKDGSIEASVKKESKKHKQKRASEV